MPYITLHQMETGRIIGLTDHSNTKDDWIEYAFEHHASCDTIKMLEDLPAEVFDAKQGVEMHIMIIRT